VAGFWKFTEGRREKAEDKRWDDLHRHLDARMRDISENQKQNKEEWIKMERSLLELRAELPLQYVRREDYIRGQSVLETKLDAIVVKFENAMLKKGGIA
jgi:hypothetical protein